MYLKNYIKQLLKNKNLTMCLVIWGKVKIAGNEK